MLRFDSHVKMWILHVKKQFSHYFMCYILFPHVEIIIHMNKKTFSCDII